MVSYTQCTAYFLECGESGLSQPMPVADGTRCLNGAIVHTSQCSAAECSFEGLRCSDANGVQHTDTCTAYYVECADGAYTAPRPAPTTTSSASTGRSARRVPWRRAPSATTAT